MPTSLFLNNSIWRTFATKTLPLCLY